MAHLRAFKPVGDAALSTISGTAIKVITYNILANRYAMSGHHNYCPPQHLDWGYRCPRILQELGHYDADIICLQEVQQDAFTWQIDPWFKRHDYTSVYQPRPLPYRMGNPDLQEGVVLYVRNSCFEVVAKHAIRFEDHASGAAVRELMAEREEGAAMALLVHRTTSKPLVACATHIFWNPTLPDVKALQVSVLCSQIGQFCEAHQLSRDTPVIVGGDFNSLWRKWQSDAFDQVPLGVDFLTSGVYDLMSTGQLPVSHIDHPVMRCTLRGDRRRADFPAEPLTTSGLKFTSLNFMAEGREPAATNITGTFRGCLDYVWLSQGHFAVRRLLEAPAGLAAAQRPSEVSLGPIPDAVFPSDHLAVGGEVVLL